MKLLLLKLRFFIRVKVLKLPFLTKRERRKVYEFLLKRVDAYIQGIADTARFSSFCHCLDTSENPVYKKYRSFIKQSSIKENYPELYKQKPYVPKHREYPDSAYENEYWFPLTQDGMYKRQDLLHKAIAELK